MPSQNAAYDLTLLLSTSVPEEQRTKVLDEVRKILSTGKGEVASIHAWGQRKTAYEIDHQNDAELHLLQFVGSPQLPSAVDHYLRIADGVVRHRIIRRPGGPGPVPDISKMPEPAGAGVAPDAPPAVERL